MFNKALLFLSITIPLAAMGWAQVTIDDKIKKEQDALSNPNLPPQVKAVAQQRIARLQQAKTIEVQLQAAQQYRDSTPDLSSEDKAKIDATISQLQAQLNTLAGNPTNQPSTNPASPSQAKSTDTPPQPVASQPKNPDAALPSPQAQPASAPQPSSAARAIGDCRVSPDTNRQVCSLTKAKMLAATDTGPVKTLAEVLASTITKDRGDKDDVFPTITQRMAMLTIFGAIDPDDVVKVSGDDLGLLKRKVNVQTETARTDKQITAPGNNSGSFSFRLESALRF